MSSFDAAAGTVFWITGLAGAGKTTIGALLAGRLTRAGPKLVFLDGDGLREMLGNTFGHGPEERLRLARCYARLCGMLSEQGIHVVCATVSMFHEVREWNRGHLRSYREIYIRAPMAVLIRRDPKRLYSDAAGGSAKQVVGVDLPSEEPRTPDVVLDNDGSRTPEDIVDELLEKLGMAKGAG